MADKVEGWRKRLAACRASGLPTAAFCREHGLAYAQYMYWQHRLGKESRGLVPVRVTTLVAPGSSLSLEVTLAAAVLRVQGITVADVVALVRSLAC